MTTDTETQAVENKKPVFLVIGVTTMNYVNRE